MVTMGLRVWLFLTDLQTCRGEVGSVSVALPAVGYFACFFSPGVGRWRCRGSDGVDEMGEESVVGPYGSGSLVETSSWLDRDEVSTTSSATLGEESNSCRICPFNHSE